MSRKSVQRRSALSFAGADDSIDHYIDNIVQSDPWKHVEKIEKSDAARIQSVLNEFNDRITQEKTCKAGLTKKNSKQPTESVVKSSTEDLITTNSEGTSSNMHNDILVPKTKDQTRKKTSKKQAPETVEETSSQELQHVVDDIKKTSKKKGRKTSESNVKEIVVNESVKKTNKKDVINMIDINPQTSTPKQKLPTTVGETAKDGKSIIRKRKMTDSENKSEKCIKPEGKKQRKRTSKKNAKDIEHCQDEVSKNMPGNGEKIMNMEEVKNLECNKENHNALKSEVKYENKSNKKVSDKNNHLQAEESKNISENKMKCKVVDNQCEIKNICTKLKKLKNKNELPKNVTSNKSSKPLKSNVENIKCQCKKKCAENCGKDEQCLLKTREQLEKRREHKKSKKAAKAMAKLSHEISTVKKKMESIKNDLESSESLDSSDYSDDRSYSSSYSSYSGSSHSSDYNSSDFTSDDTEYTSDSSDSSTCSEDTNTNESKSSR